MSRLDTLAANDSSPQQWACDRSSHLSIGEFRRWPLSILSWPLAGLRAASRAQSSASPLAACAARPLAPCPLVFQKLVLTSAKSCALLSIWANCSSSPAQSVPSQGAKLLNLPQDKWVTFFFCLFAKNVKCNLLLAGMFWSWIGSFLLHVFSSARPWGVHINGFVQLQLEEVEEFRMNWWHHSLKAIL